MRMIFKSRQRAGIESELEVCTRSESNEARSLITQHFPSFFFTSVSLFSDSLINQSPTFLQQQKVLSLFFFPKKVINKKIRKILLW